MIWGIIIDTYKFIVLVYYKKKNNWQILLVALAPKENKSHVIFMMHVLLGYVLSMTWLWWLKYHWVEPPPLKGGGDILCIHDIEQVYIYRIIIALPYHKQREGNNKRRHDSMSWLYVRL